MKMIDIPAESLTDGHLLVIDGSVFDVTYVEVDDDANRVIATIDNDWIRGFDLNDQVTVVNDLKTLRSVLANAYTLIDRDDPESEYTRGMVELIAYTSFPARIVEMTDVEARVEIAHAVLHNSTTLSDVENFII